MQRYNYLFAVCLSLLSATGLAQKYTTEKSYVKFFSDAAIEDIAAENAKTQGIFNTATNDIAFSVPIGDFEFEKSLMKEHFNEKYMESEKYPKATFAGKVSGYAVSGTGAQQAKATGKLTVHGVTKEVTIDGTIQKAGDKLEMKAKFIVVLKDYNVKIPQLLWQNIAEQVEVTVEFVFAPQ